MELNKEFFKHLEFRALLLFVLVVPFNSCTSNEVECLDAGPIESEVISLNNSISSFSTNLSSTILYNKGTVTQIDVTGNSNIIPFLNTEVQDGTWNIELEKGVCFNEFDLQIQIRSEYLNSITSHGTDFISINSLEVNEEHLSIFNDGSGDLIFSSPIEADIDCTLAGSGNIVFKKTETLSQGNIIQDGSGAIDVSSKSFDFLEINVPGSGSVFIGWADSLKVTISGSGNVFYDDAGHIISEITGTGKLIKN